MTRERVSWRDRYPAEVTCVRCLDVVDQLSLDRMLWCVDCRRRARDRASWWGWLGGFLFAGALGLYVWFAVRPTDLVVGGWAGTLVAAVWIGQKVARELVYGAMRFRNARAVEAMPPTGDGGEGLADAPADSPDEVERD